MTITITLTPEQEARLLERAAREGRDADTIVQDEVHSFLDGPPPLTREELTRHMNEAYGGPPDEDERRTMEAMRRSMRRRLEGEEW